MKILLGLLMIVFSITCFAKEELYVQSAKSRIYEQPSFKSKIVIAIDKGTKVEIIEKKNDWCRVSANQVTGWVSALTLGASSPLNKDSVFTGQEENIEKSARRRASTVSTAGAVRGLTDEDRQRIDEDTTGNFRALQRIENIHITPKELDTFVSPLQPTIP